MKRVSWPLLSFCVAILPLFSGCGGCGGPASSVEAMQRARGSWGADDEEEESAAAAPAPAAAPVAATPSQPQPPTAQPAPPVAPATTPAEATPAIVQAPTVAPPPASDAELIVIPTGGERLRRITTMSKSPEFRRLAISNQPLGLPPVAGEAPAVAEATATAAVPQPPSTAVSTAAPPETENAAASEPDASESAENLLKIRPPAPSTVSLVPQAKALADATNETDADRMLLGEAMLRDRLEDWPFQMRWSPALKRPAPWLRAGVAFEVSTIDLRSDETGALPPKDRALERDFGAVGGSVLNLGGEVAEKTLAPYLTLVRSGALGPTLAPRAAGPVDRGRPLPVRLCGGLMVFGPGEERLLKAHAERLGLDLLIVFEVRAKRNPNDPNQPINDTSAKIIDIVGDREIYKSATVRNLDVLETRKNPGARDPMEPIVADIKTFIETQLPLEDIPAEVNPDNVRARIGSLIDQALASKNALPFLVEIKSLQLKGYLSGLEARNAYIAIVGETEGEALYSGSAEARVEALQALLPKMPKTGGVPKEPAPAPSPTETVKTGG